jgi:DNA polymerase-3 subunit delta'
MKFSSVVGQSEIKSKMISGVQAGRIPHAQLMLGMEGSGALPLALAYATYINCQNKGADDSCGECPSCRKIASLTHPDVHFSFPFPSNKGDYASELYTQWRKSLIENSYITYDQWMSALEAENKQGNIPVDECHAIIKKLSMKNYEGDYKILIMWLPEFLGNQGNVLLKIIEEPPANTLFLLVAEKADKILSTILSRTQLIRIPPIAEHEIASHLMSTLGIDDESAKRVALMSGGDLVLATELAQNAESRFFEPFTSLMRICYKQDAPAIIAWAEEQSSMGREQLKGFLLYALELIRASLTIKFIGQRTGLNEAEAKFMTDFSATLSNRRIDMLYELLNTAIFEVERNANAKLVLTDAGIKISRIFR